MDRIISRDIIKQFIKKYAYVLLVLVTGIFLMVLPEPESTEQQPLQIKLEEESLEESLENILSYLSGAGNVKVLLTESKGEEQIYQMDEEGSMGSVQKKTILVTDSSKEESGLLRHVLYPEYRGAVVICEGADNPKVKLAIVEAVRSATGLMSDHITVLKMK